MLGHLYRPPPPNPAYATQQDREDWMARIDRVNRQEAIGSLVLVFGIVLSLVLTTVIVAAWYFS